MTLEEHIETEKRIAKEFIDRSQSTRVGAVVLHMYEDMYRTHIERADLLEELKTLRKAFELACEELVDYRCWNKHGSEILEDCANESCGECWKEYLIQKARKEIE